MDYVETTLNAIVSDPLALLGIWLIAGIVGVISNFRKWALHGRKIAPNAPRWMSVAYLYYDGLISRPLSAGMLLGTMTYLGLLACRGEGLTVGTIWCVSLILFSISLRNGNEWKRYRPIVIEGWREDPIIVAWNIVAILLLLPGLIVSEQVHELGDAGFRYMMSVHLRWISAQKQNARNT